MLKLEINTSNAAFHNEDPLFDNSTMAREIWDITSKMCNEIHHGRTRGICVDHNGNQVGDWSLTEGGKANDE